MLSQNFQDKKINSNLSELPSRFIPYNISNQKNQHKIILDNIEIFFPFSPHKTQIIYMQKILYNLNQKFLLKNKYKAIAALESPIGTGKTLCLLCATLAWLNDMRKTNLYKGKIIYAAKSYNRISHIIKELNKTYYKPKICILFSPYDACINDKINSSKNDNIIYMKCNKCFNCEFYKNYEKYVNNENNNSYNDNKYLDIEELSDFLCNKKICPFYFEKNSVSNSDIIFMPYEFLFDKKMTKILNIDINNNIIIFDESHNLPKLCEEINNISINTNDFEEIIQELNEFIINQNKNYELNDNKKIDENEIKCEILSINKIINNINSNNLNILQGEVYPDKGLLLSNKDFLSLFLTNNNYQKKNDKENENSIKTELEYVTLDNINKHIILLKNIRKLININFERKSKLSIYISLLEKINNFYINQNDNLIDSYIFFISYKRNENNELFLIRKLNIYCFSPSLSFKELLDNKPYSIFFISATLAPFDILEKEFKIKFDIKLENKHMIEEEQFKFNIIQSSIYNSEKIVFKLDYIQRTNNKMIIALGNTLLSLCETNNKGSILVYFPSLIYLNQCSLIWKENKILDKLQEIKIVYSQKNTKSNKLENDKNYIFFEVFNKNTSPEEIFFTKTKITIVICLGVPYDTEFSFDDKIQLKIRYLDTKIKNDNNKKNKDEITGEKWYENKYISIINLFLGKSLKLMSGYGSLICIDTRYESAFKNELFSLYLRDNCKIINIENNTYFDSLKSFYDKINIDNNLNLGFFKEIKNDLNLMDNKKGKNINYLDEDDESENYYFDKKYKNKIFNLQKKEHNQIDINDILNNTKKLEELVLNSNKLNKIFDLSNINTTIKKSKNFLQRKLNKIYEKFSDKNNDENNINFKNKKLKREEDNSNLLIKNSINNSNNNIFQNFSDAYNEIIKEKNKEDENLEINENNHNNENINNINNSNNNMNEGVDFKPNPEILEQLNNNIYTSEAKEDYECPICFKTSSKNHDLIYSISKCHHVLCNICWSEWLAEKLECPLCKAKTRPKTLKKIVFKE